MHTNPNPPIPNGQSKDVPLEERYAYLIEGSSCFHCHQRPLVLVFWEGCQFPVGPGEFMHPYAIDCMGYLQRYFRPHGYPCCEGIPNIKRPLMSQLEREVICLTNKRIWHG